MLEVSSGDAAEPSLQQGAVDPRGVLESAALGVRLTEADAGRGLDELRDATGREEHVWSNGSPEEHVVVGVEEVLAEPLDPVQLALDGMGIVGRKRIQIGKELLTSHDRDTGMPCQPRRCRRVGRDEDAPDPGCVKVDAAQSIFELVDLSESRIRIIPVADDI